MAGVSGLRASVAGDPGVARGANGFSLVETVVTIAVIGVLAAIAFPSLRGLLPRVRLENNTRTLANELILARKQAIAQSLDYSVVFDTVAESYTLWKGAVGAGTLLGTNHLAGSDIVGLSGFSTANRVVAQAGGAMNVPLEVGGSANVGYVTLQTPDGSRIRRIRVEPLGRIVVER